ncbi:MAG: hypothetical protein ACM3ZE_29465 [Myxococcales bacterium]
MMRTHGGGARWVSLSWRTLICLGLAVAGGCNASDESSDMNTAPSEGDANGGYDTGSRGAAYSNSSPGSGGSTEPGLTVPDEQEVAVELDAPQSSVNYVYATNPDRDSVAVISASSLAIHVVDTGDQPRFLQTIPGRDAALVVDVGASDIAYIQTVDGKSTVQYFRDLPSANVVRVAPDGKHAVAYFDVSRVHQGRFETLQDVSVLTFDDAGARAVRMTVGFKPRQVTFAGGAAGSAAAYLVTEDGISVLDFAKIDAERRAAIADTIPIFSATEAQGADVTVTPDGRFALGRIKDTSKLRLVDLATGDTRSLDAATLLRSPQSTELQGIGGSVAGQGGAAAAGEGGFPMAGSAGAPVGNGGFAEVSSKTGSTSEPSASAEITDLDVSPDGTYALTVSRNRGALLRIPIPGGFLDPTVVTRTPIADVAAGAAAISTNGRWAVLYTTVLTSERRVAILDLSGQLPQRVLDLTKSIKGIAFSSSGDQAYVVHNKGEGALSQTGLTPEEVLERSHGYTLIDLKRAFRKLQITETEANLSVTTPSAPYVFLSFQSDGASTYGTMVQRLDMESLQVSSIQLGSIPISMGVVPAAARVFVSQQYDDGRLTFIDWATLDTTTVTGYELNSKIRE